MSSGMQEAFEQAKEKGWSSQQELWSMAWQAAQAQQSEIHQLLVELAEYAPPEGVLIAPTVAIGFGRRAKHLLGAGAASFATEIKCKVCGDAGFVRNPDVCGENDMLHVACPECGAGHTPALAEGALSAPVAAVDLLKQQLQEALEQRNAAAEAAGNTASANHKLLMENKALKAAAAQAAIHFVPEGYALVPQQMLLEPAALDALMYHGGRMDGEGEACDALLWVGETDDEERGRCWGLNVTTAECPEEGSSMLVEFAPALSVPAITRQPVLEDKPDAYECVKQLASGVLEVFLSYEQLGEEDKREPLYRRKEIPAVQAQHQDAVPKLLEELRVFTEEHDSDRAGVLRGHIDYLTQVFSDQVMALARARSAKAES